MFANRVPAERITWTDDSSIGRALNAVRKTDYLRMMLTPECVETIVIIRNGQVIRSAALDRALLFYVDTYAMLSDMQALGCAVAMPRLAESEWLV